MKLLLKIWNNFSYPLLLILIEAVLFVANFTPKTFLIGWDNVMPEFNLKLNYIRAISSVWQEYRGLGTLDGMAHAANLMHVFYINLLSFILPQNMLRYAFIDLTHVIGGVAFYYLALRLFKNKHGAFLGAILYLFNLGVIQMYFAPLEVFAVHFAALPIMGLAILNALKSNSKKSLALLGLASFATTPQAFVPTVFIAYGIFVTFLLLFSFKKILIKRIVLIISILFITNAFWLLPFSYTAIFKSSVIQNTRINEFSSEEIYYRNQARGTLSDVLTFKGFMLDTIEYDSFKKQNFSFMQNWLDAAKSVPYSVISVVIAALLLLGSFLVIRFRLKSMYPFLATNIISLVLLANNTPVLGNINEILRNTFPLFGEAFRFPFTKFITVFAFSYSLLFGLGASFAIKFILNTFSSLLKRFGAVKNNIKLITAGFYVFMIAFVASLILYTAIPAFKGNFTSPFLRLSLPNDYLQTMNYFNSEDPNGRILTFPLNSFWNWEYRDWGHRGSGFLWYGIPQPLLIRAFDPWSNYNEQLYNEFATAYSNDDITSFDALLKKYDVSYILIDKTVLNTISPKPIDYDQIQLFLDKSTVILKDKSFGHELVYKSKSPVSPISILPLKNTVSVAPLVTQQSSDAQSLDSGNYISDKDNADIITPLASLATLKLQKDNQFNWNYKNNMLTFSARNLPITNTKGKKLIIPSLFQNEFLIPVSVATGENTVALTPLYPSIIINGKSVPVNSTPIIIHTENVVTPTKITFIDTNNTIDIASNKTNSFLLNNFTNTIKISDGINEEYAQIDTSSINKTPYSIPIQYESINSFEVSVPTFDTELGKSNYVKNKQYIITKSSDQSKLKIAGAFSKTTVESDGVLMESKSNSTSLDIYLDTVFHAASYAVVANTTHVSGLPVNFYVDNPKESKPVMENRLDQNGNNIAVITSTDTYSKGYGFHFGVKSVGTEDAVSKINDVSIFSIPEKTIEGIKILNPDAYVLTSINPVKKSVPFVKTGNFSYETTATIGSVLTLSQAYDKAWNAYTPKFIIRNSAFKSFLFNTFPFIFGKKIENHILVNNWANGWEINSQASSLSPEVVIVYLPQYLEILGFALLGLPLLFGLIGIYEHFMLPITTNTDRFFEEKSQDLKQKIHSSLHPEN